MRKLGFSLLIAAGLAAISAVPANAGRGDWQCLGAEYVCGSAKASAPAARATRTKAVNNRKARVARAYSEDRPVRQRRRAVPSVTSSSYSGGGSTGIASYYWQGQRVASGGWFNPNGMTAAHRTLPFGTKVRVTHLGNGRSVTVTINDRGPFIKGRIIDLSRGAASVIGMTGQGLARVSVDVLGRS